MNGKNNPADANGRREPSLKEFAALLDRLAGEVRNESGQEYLDPEWVRRGVSVAGTKFRALRYMQRCSGLQPPRLLDVGAHVGAFCAYAAELGFRAAGVDYERYRCRFAPLVERSGVDYRACDVAVQPLPFDDAAFDFVTYMDVIEHHAFSPRRVLTEIHRVLAPGGRLIVTTPNHASIYNRLSLLLGRSVNDDFSHFYNASSAAEIYHGHHREYTRAELRAAMAGAGFRVVECRVFDEDPGPMHYYMRNYPGGSERWVWANLAAGVAGRVFETLHLPFGRLLWGVGEKQ